MQSYFWENMLTDGLCDSIIDWIKGSIVLGFNEIDIQDEMEPDTYYGMSIGDIFLLKCNRCNQYKSSSEVESSRGGGGITKLEACVRCCDCCDSDDSGSE
jgi:hypothetical protein